LLPSLQLKLALVNAVCLPLPDFWNGIIRSRLLALIGFRIHPGVSIFGRLTFYGPGSGWYERCSVGQDAIISTDVVLDLDERITIGRNVTIGPEVVIYIPGPIQSGPAAGVASPLSLRGR